MSNTSNKSGTHLNVYKGLSTQKFQIIYISIKFLYGFIRT